jgi:hypothetical protein
MFEIASLINKKISSSQRLGLLQIGKLLFMQDLQFTEKLMTAIIKRTFVDVKQGTNRGQLRAKW